MSPASPPSVQAQREKLTRLVDTLTSLTAMPLEQLSAAREWYRWALECLGLPEGNDPTRPDDEFEQDTIFTTGKAINPRSAARCVWEYVRTAKFLRAMEEAIEAARARFPGETIHVLEAGCGPLATLSLPFAVRHPAEEVQFSLLDIHPISLDCCARLASSLGVTQSFRNFWCHDGASYRLPTSERPHIIACEVMQRALLTEPQVAVTRNLYPQLRPGGIFLPECIDVDLVLFAAGLHYRRLTDPAAASGEGADTRRQLGRACRLLAPGHVRDADEAAPLFETHRIPLPAFRGTGSYPHLFTRIKIWGEHRLEDFECSLNLPLDVPLPEAVGHTDCTLAFHYEISGTPRLRAEPVEN